MFSVVDSHPLCTRTAGELSRVEYERSRGGAGTRNLDEGQRRRCKTRFNAVFDHVATLLDTFQISAMQDSYGPTGARLRSTRPLSG